MMPAAIGAQVLRVMRVVGAERGRPMRDVVGAIDGGGLKRQQPPRTLARKVAMKHAERPSSPHGGPRDNAVRRDVGAITAVDTNAP